MSASSTSRTGHLLNVGLGLAASLIAVVISLVVWLFAFDSSGIEPGGATGHAVSRLWPIFFMFVAASSAAWCFHRTAVRRLAISLVVALCTFATMGLYWRTLG